MSYDGPNQILLERVREGQLKPPLQSSAASSSMELRNLTKEIADATRRNSFEDAMALFQTVSEPDELLYGTYLNACCKALRSKEAWDVFRAMPEAMRGLVVYNTMLDLCKRLRRSFDAEKLFREMDERGVTKSIITYNTMISAFSMAGEPDRALALFEELRGGQLWAETSSSNQQRSFLAVMSATARTGNYAKTRELFMAMMEARVPVTNLHLNALLTSCANDAHADIAKQVFDSIPAYGLTKRIEDYTAVISCCRNNLEDCQRYYDEAIHLGLRPSVQTKEKMLEAYVIAKDKAGAQRVVDETPTLNHKSRKNAWLLEELERL